MQCLYCGDCCLRISPISAPEPCPHIIKEGSFCFCSIYFNRPDQCKKHSFPSLFCPIGIEKLALKKTKIKERIEFGRKLLAKTQEVKE